MGVQRSRAVVLGLALVLSLSWSPDSGLAQAPVGSPAENDLTVMSLNLALREDVTSIVDGIRAASGNDPDILVFQEVVQAPGRTNVAEQIAAVLGSDSNAVYQAVFRPAFGLDDGRTVGLATVSRFPIAEARALALKRFSLGFRSRERTALAATIEAPSGPVRTYNVHLDTRINGGDRIEQIGGVIEDLDAAAGRAIVAGDFNTNDHLWLFHVVPLPFLGRQGNGLERYMSRHGLTSAFPDGATHDVLRMRLDWMFLKDLRPTRREIHRMEISDHHALVARLQ